MDITSLIIQLVSGAVGGNIGGAIFKNLSLGTTGNSIAGIIGGPLIMIGSLEGAGLTAAADINVIGFAVWSLWLIATGISLLFTKATARQ